MPNSTSQECWIHCRMDAFGKAWKITRKGQVLDGWVLLASAHRSGTSLYFKRIRRHKLVSLDYHLNSLYVTSNYAIIFYRQQTDIFHKRLQGHIWVVFEKQARLRHFKWILSGPSFLLYLKWESLKHVNLTFIKSNKNLSG